MTRVHWRTLCQYHAAARGKHSAMRAAKQNKTDGMFNLTWSQRSLPCDVAANFKDDTARHEIQELVFAPLDELMLGVAAQLQEDTRVFINAA